MSTRNYTAVFMLLILMGLVIFAAGVVLAIDDYSLNWSYSMIGVGAGFAGGCAGQLWGYRRLKKDPQLAKQKEIAVKDERNRMALCKAKARVFDFVVIAFAPVLIIFSILGVELYVTVTILALYLLILAFYVFFANKYYREM